MNKLWFGCPKCHLAFHSRREYEKHYVGDHPGSVLEGAGMIESRG